jgi:hypothetical protein
MALRRRIGQAFQVNVDLRHRAPIIPEMLEGSSLAQFGDFEAVEKIKINPRDERVKAFRKRRTV